MSDLLRMTGMYSGMDTESIIQQLVKAKSTKVTNLKNDQKKLEWKQTMWQDLNKRIYKLYSNTLSNMRLTGSYAKKTSKISDPNKATIVASESAVNGTQTLEIKKTAKSGYLTGAVVSKSVSNVTKKTKLSDLGVGTGGQMKIEVGTSPASTTTINIDPSKSIGEFVDAFNSDTANNQGLQMQFKSGKITVTGPDGTTPYKLTSTLGNGKSTIVGALGLGDCSDGKVGAFTGNKIRILGDTSQSDITTKLEDLNIKGGKLTVKKSDGSSVEIEIDKSMSVNSFITKFNKETGLTMSLKGGKITVEDPSGGDFTLASTEGDSGVSVLAGLGLGSYGGDKQTGKITGSMVSKLLNPSENYQDETNVTLEDLQIGDGTLNIKTASGVISVQVNKKDTVEQFMDAFNKANAEANGGAGTGLSMSIEDGKLSIEAAAGTKYTLESEKAGTSGNTVLQGLGLGQYSGAEQDGTIQGSIVTKLNPVVAGDFTLETTLSEIDPSLAGQTLRLTVGSGTKAQTTEIKLTSDMKISELVSQLKDAGVNASFDTNNQRFFISSAGTGADKEFKLDATGGALQSLGLDPDAQYANGSTSTRIYAQDAEIVLNGATFTSDTNTFSVNGLSITTNAVTDEPITITTDTDYDGIYNMIKDFIEEYNDIMNEVTKLYNADSARKYAMLSDEEKEAMSDEEVEKWESTIKDSLLRRDKDLYSVMECMRGAINKGYEIGGETLYLVNFGVGTGSYFDTEKAERNALHIFGDSDDEKYADKDNELKAAIAEDPDKVIELFAAMSKNMYDSLYEVMGSTDYRSIYKVYDDKRMKTEYDDYTTKIKEAEQKLNDYEDKWYKKFSAMEVALSKLQSNQNSLASMLGQ